MHSDQGWQYQQWQYRGLLCQHGITQSMSRVLSPVKLTLIKTKTQFFLSDQIVVIFRHGLVISFSGNELIREVHYSSTNLFL